MDRVTEEDRRIRLLVAESFRRTYGTPTMTDAEFDTLVQAFLDDQKPADPSPSGPASQLERGINAPSRDHNEQEHER